MMFIVKPLITEKTIKEANEKNKYSFIVANNANKIEVAKEVKDKFDVKVTGVTIMNVLGKKVRFGKKRREGSRSTYKKAIVSLDKGSKISVFDVK